MATHEPTQVAGCVFAAATASAGIAVPATLEQPRQPGWELEAQKLQEVLDATASRHCTKVTYLTSRTDL